MNWLRFILSGSTWLALGGVLCVFISVTHAQSNLPDPIPITAEPNELANQILYKSILHSVWGPPVHCVVRQSVSLFGKQVNGVGEFVRGGQGSGKLKMSLRMPAADQLNSLLQVSDGQRLLSVESIGEIKRRTEIDLGKIRPRLIFTNDSLQDPLIAMYLAIGGQAESLRKICQQYDWYSVREDRLGETNVWQLSGRLSTIPHPVRAAANVDNNLFADSNSGLLPTEIQLTIGFEDSPVPFWLYQVDQRRDVNKTTALGRSSDLHIVTEWASPTVIDPQRLSADLFEAPYSNEILFDETENYLPPDFTAQASLPSLLR